MEEEKRDVEHVEKAYDVSPAETDTHAEQDWTPEEEKAIVYEVGSKLLHVSNVAQSQSRLACLPDVVLRFRSVTSRPNQHIVCLHCWTFHRLAARHRKSLQCRFTGVLHRRVILRMQLHDQSLTVFRICAIRVAIKLCDSQSWSKTLAPVPDHSMGCMRPWYGICA
jgi:hypothetical protein